MQKWRKDIIRSDSMIFSLRVECDCGSYAYFKPERHTLKDEKKVYEDYSSIEDGIIENPIFFASTLPDTVRIVCKVCGHSHDLVT